MNHKILNLQYNIDLSSFKLLRWWTKNTSTLFTCSSGGCKSKHFLNILQPTVLLVNKVNNNKIISNMKCMNLPV